MRLVPLQLACSLSRCARQRLSIRSPPSRSEAYLCLLPAAPEQCSPTKVVTFFLLWYVPAAVEPPLTPSPQLHAPMFMCSALPRGEGSP